LIWFTSFEKTDGYPVRSAPPGYRLGQILGTQ
jgi:hypothetical protein